MVTIRFAESRFAETHFVEVVSPKGRFAERIFHQKDVSLKGRFAERTFRRKFFGLHYDNSDQNFLSVKWIRRNVHSVKRPFGETSFRGNVHSAKRPFGETASAKWNSAKRIRRNVRIPKYSL